MKRKTFSPNEIHHSEHRHRTKKETAAQGLKREERKKVTPDFLPRQADGFVCLSILTLNGTTVLLCKRQIKHYGRPF